MVNFRFMNSKSSDKKYNFIIIKQLPNFWSIKDVKLLFYELQFFADALASIFRTDSANIFIINIEDDTDVAPAQILNVSVSVRKGSISVQGRTQDVFYPPEYLREYIYLYRTLLANLSALQVTDPTKVCSIKSANVAKECACLESFMYKRTINSPQNNKNQVVVCHSLFQNLC